MLKDKPTAEQAAMISWQQGNPGAGKIWS